MEALPGQPCVQDVSQEVVRSEGETSSPNETNCTQVVLYRPDDVMAPDDVITVGADMSWYALE